MSKSPAFQFYPQDFMSDINVKVMTTEAVGAYWLLLCHDWIECGLPDDDRSLAVLSGMNERWCEVSEQVLKCFKKRGTKIYNPRLEKERKKQKNFREQKSEAGKASAKSRKNKKLKQKKEVNECSIPVEFPLNECCDSVATKFNSSSSSSSSNREREEKSKKVPDVPEKIIEAARPILGLTCEMTLIDWVRTWGEEWVLKALAITATRDLPYARAASYCQAIMRDWQDNGEPDERSKSTRKTRRSDVRDSEADSEYGKRAESFDVPDMQEPDREE